MAIGADEIVVIRPIELAGGEALGVKTNVDNISCGERPADTLSIGSNEGDVCAHIIGNIQDKTERGCATNCGEPV